MMKCYQKIITPIVNVTDEFGNVTNQYIDLTKVEITNTVVVVDGFIGQWNYTAGNLYSLQLYNLGFTDFPIDTDQWISKKSINISLYH